MATKITVAYWRGTLRLTGTATTYRGVMRIAKKNRNACGARFYSAAGQELFDLGGALAAAPDAGQTVVHAAL